MFTGIVEELGLVRETGGRMAVFARKVTEDSDPGASIAVNGVCVTVVEKVSEDGGARLSFDLSPETLARTSLGTLSAGDGVNLERPVTLLARLGGHLVQGHVDGVGEVVSVEDVAAGKVIAITVPEGLRRYVVEKGSIAVDGVSLTVTEIAGGGTFGVALVPYTLEATTLGKITVGDKVNLEVDLMAKYVESLLGNRT
jgi:riboflavin synthase